MCVIASVNSNGLRTTDARQTVQPTRTQLFDNFFIRFRLPEWIVLTLQIFDDAVGSLFISFSIFTCPADNWVIVSISTERSWFQKLFRTTFKLSDKMERSDAKPEAERKQKTDLEHPECDVRHLTHRTCSNVPSIRPLTMPCVCVYASGCVMRREIRFQPNVDNN